MKLNWKVIFALVILVGAVFWSVSSLLIRSYSGTDLNFGIGSGPITVTNPSDEAFPAQFVSTTPGTFTVLSSITSISGNRSSTQGSGRNATQLFELVLPPGVSEFSVVRGGDVSFIVNARVPLDATVEPLNAEEARTTLIVAAIAIAGSLFYLSRANGHRWISASRRQQARERIAAQEAEQKNFDRLANRMTSNKL